MSYQLCNYGPESPCLGPVFSCGQWQGPEVPLSSDADPLAWVQNPPLLATLPHCAVDLNHHTNKSGQCSGDHSSTSQNRVVLPFEDKLGEVKASSLNKKRVSGSTVNPFPKKTFLFATNHGLTQTPLTLTKRGFAQLPDQQRQKAHLAFFFPEMHLYQVLQAFLQILDSLRACMNLGDRQNVVGLVMNPSKICLVSGFMFCASPSYATRVSG